MAADALAYLGFSQNPDGSIARVSEQPTTPASSDPANPFQYLSKDIPINQSKGTFARIFVPTKTFGSSSAEKLPLIVYFHGGGFVICRVNSTMFDGFYTTIAANTPAVVVSIAYRLAPEHRLPAAFDDSEEGLHWVKSCKDEWLTKYADLSNCFLMGTSAGANIAYHLGIRAAAAESGGDLLPIRIRGIILHHPFFGGAQRSGSELRLADDKVLPLPVTDLLWELSIPIGADRNYEYCNAALAIRSGQFDGIKVLGWKVLVTGCDGDPLLDRQVEMATKLEENGVPVVAKFDQGGFHGCDLFDPDKAKVLSANLREFLEYAISS